MRSHNSWKFVSTSRFVLFGVWLASVAAGGCTASENDPLPRDEDTSVENDTNSEGSTESPAGCSAAAHQEVMDVAVAAGRSLGPVSEECYPTSLSGTLAFTSTFSTPPVAAVSATFTAGELTDIDGVACEAVFPGQAPTFYDCQVEFVCGCCRVMYEISSMVNTPALTFITTGSAAECQDLLNSGSFEYEEAEVVDTESGGSCGGYNPCCEDCSADCDWCGSDMPCFQDCYGECMNCCSSCY